MNKTMRAAVFKGNGVLSVEDREIPRIIHPDDVLIKVEAGSICGSDIHCLSVPPGQYAKPDTVMGHEFVGYVEETGPAAGPLKQGDRVVVEPLINCGYCAACRKGHYNLCPNVVSTGQTRDGGFAEYVVLPARKLHQVPKDIPARIAAQTEPLACVMSAMMKINPTPMDRVVIFGAGPIGLIFTRLMKLYGIPDVVVCDTLEQSRKFAEHCGADLVIDSVNENVAEILQGRWGELCDIIVEAVGAGPVPEQAVQLLNPAGRLLIFGQNSKSVSSIHPADIVTRELQVIGSFCPNNSFPAAIRLLSDPRLGLDMLVSHEIGLEEIVKGMEYVRTKEASRVIVYPGR